MMYPFLYLIKSRPFSGLGNTNLFFREYTNRNIYKTDEFEWAAYMQAVTNTDSKNVVENHRGWRSGVQVLSLLALLVQSTNADAAASQRSISTVSSGTSRMRVTSGPRYRATKEH
jgi:hypothetical protein